MFCSCAVAFGAPPNSLTCPVCLGHPGVLPVINRQAVVYAAKTALALNLTVAPFTKWDRKSYWYPDLPKNYQISQYDLPLGRAGRLEIPLADGSLKPVRILRAHLEEDAGKNLHDDPDHTLVDLNRTGTPLLEIVTEPDIASAEEAGALARELQRIVRYLGVSEADMQKGHMRFEPNINCEIEAAGRMDRTPIIEVKNLNSFRALEGAVAFEHQRQVVEYLADPTYTIERLGKQNRGWDDLRQETVPQRHKEEAHEYRYFPEPDLVPVELPPELIDGLRREVPELPLARRRRLAGEVAITPDDALTITDDRATGDLFEAALRRARERGGGTRDPGRTLAKHFLGFWRKHAHEAGTTIAGLGLAADHLGELAAIVADGTINATAAQRVAEEMRSTGEPPGAIAERLSLRQISDPAALRALVEEAVAANPDAVRDYQGGGRKHKKAFGFLQGQVMRLSGGSAQPQLVAELLREKLGPPKTP
jgi:aspartyl-tRNA(Asn)/glutamyl-tRNA(Gln) amidotransferase subunit B